MRNRAKCKKCESVIESFFAGDYVTCKCGEISVQGAKRVAGDWENYIALHDDDSEHPVKAVDKPEDAVTQDAGPVPTREDMIGMLEDMSKVIEGLPEHAMMSPITHYDFGALITLLVTILRSKPS